MCDKDNIIDWKRLWQLVSGIHHETPEITVRNELFDVSKKLQDGLLQFKSAASSNIQLETLLNEKKQIKLLSFTQQLQMLLDLDAQQCWEILCFYLSNEYRGSTSFLINLIASENNMSQLLNDIWGYYTLERMFVLKIVKNLLMFYGVSEHPYHKEYQEVVEKIGLDKLKESYLKQLKYLVNEEAPHKLVSGELLNYQTHLVNWSERNAREIIEICQTIILLCDHTSFNVEDVKQIFNAFKQHSFGRQQNYFLSSNATHAELVHRITYIEVAVFLKLIDFEDSHECVIKAKEIIDSLDITMTRFSHNAEYGPILLGWMFLNLRFTDATENESQLLRCRQMGKRALDLNCFQYLYTMISNSMFKDDCLVSRIIRKTVYSTLSHMCDYFDGDGSCAEYNYIYELLCELISFPVLGQEFCDNEDSGIRSLYNTLLKTFPIDFIHLSMLATSLTKAGMGGYIRKQLESLPFLTDIYDANKYSLKIGNNNEYVVTETIRPFPRIEFVILPGTVATMSSRSEGNYVHFHSNVNYFQVLQYEINCLLSETMEFYGDFQCSERARRVNEGYKYLSVMLQKIKTIAAIGVEMVHPTEMSIDLLNKFKEVQLPPVDLIANCMNICTALLSIAPEEIFIRVENLSILPMITNQNIMDYKKYAHGIYFDSSLMGLYLVDIEKKRQRFDILHAYLSFLRTYTKLQKRNYFQMEIPGLLFLLRDVFPHMHAWRFDMEQEKYKIYAEIMGFICDILDEVSATQLSSTEQHKSQILAQQKLLRDICVYSLLNLENGLILLRFVSLGNASLQCAMFMESNWMMPQSYGLVLLVRLSMRILMQILKMKNVIFGRTELSPLEAMIYTHPRQRDTLRIIPVVTGYMGNIFDRSLPILSCRLLKRIALEFNMSLLACLDMEPDQIRLTFLQKLPDYFESDSLKVAILELVEACIEKQPGVTEAFFKVNNHTEKQILTNKNTIQIADSIETYMEDYLDAVGKDPQIVEQMLPSKIMNLFHSLWKHNMQSLVHTLATKATFWQNICHPFFGELKPNVKAYGQLLNMLAMEIFYNGEASSKLLKDILLKFFDNKFFKEWLSFVFDLPNVSINKIGNSNFTFIISEESPEWLCRLQAFKSFLLILLKKQPQIFEIPSKQLKLLAENCLQILVKRSEYITDLRPFIIISELYLFIILSHKHSYAETDEESRLMLQQLNQLVSNISLCYTDLHIRAKEACLSLTIKCADLLSEELTQDLRISQSFLYSVVYIICTELENLENCVRVEYQTKKTLEVSTSVNQSTNSTNALILCLNLLKTVASIYHRETSSNWVLPFIANKVFQRLLSSTSSILQLYSRQELSVELLDVLIVFANGNCSSEFLHCDIGDYLWLKLLPPKELLHVEYSLMQPKKDVWTVQKWWPIYARGIELVTVLLQKHSHHFLKDILQFVGIHEEYLIDSLLLCKQSLERLAINLIRSAITLIAYLVEYEKQWRLEHSPSLFKLMQAVQTLLGHCISMFHQPKSLKLLMVNRPSQMDLLRDQQTSELTDEVISTFNDLTEIIILCVKSLQRFSPTLLDLICMPEFSPVQWECIFEIHFGAPKFNENAFTLTFGTVLSIVNVYTKVLNLQNYAFNEVPLNVLPVCINIGDDSNINTNTIRNEESVESSTPRRFFSKSMSVASVSSVSCPPNELLSNLDAELCLIALEHILSLTVSQSMLALKKDCLSPREKQIIRREISSELLSYHEFVRKKVLVDFRDYKDIWRRRKHGQILMQQIQHDNSDNNKNESRMPAQVQTTSQRLSENMQRRLSPNLRVSVVRRLHLQQQYNLQQRQKELQDASGSNDIQNKMNMSHAISPIAQAPCGLDRLLTTSTPNLPQIQTTANEYKPCNKNGDELQETIENVIINDREDIEEDITYYSPEKPKFSPISYIQFVEEDYLHLMSILFYITGQQLD